jgi:hypothetical protein
MQEAHRGHAHEAVNYEAITEASGGPSVCFSSCFGFHKALANRLHQTGPRTHLLAFLPDILAKEKKG